MKNLILDHDYELHLGGTAKPDTQKTLDCIWVLSNRTILTTILS